MSRLKTPLYLITATALGLNVYNPNLYSSFNDSSLVSPTFPEKVQTTFNGVLRSSRAISSIFLVAADYKYSMLGLSEGSEDYRNKLSEVHRRSAKKILKLCETNKGFYVKAGQFVATMKRAPEEYTSILSSLQDKVIPCHFKAIKEVLIRNLGNDFQEIFVSLDEHPIAAASIAQVHRAVLKDCQEVAVKVQYPWLEQQMKMDIATMSFLSKSFEWFFPGFRFRWLVSEFVEAISQELDFVQEAKNGERTANNFKNNKVVKVPRIFWDLTTNQVLTMEFCRGCKVDDVEYMKERGINPVKVAKALVEVFGEMIFVHGFLHGDPHPGNILVAPEGRNGFSLVLLDHGIYKELDEGFRLKYCQLWEALIAMDSKKIQHVGEQFGAGKYAMFFPFIFMGKTIDSKSAPGGGMSFEEKRNIKPEAKAKMMDEISTFIESLAPDFFLILRTDGLLRAVNKTLGASQQVRLLAYAKYAFQGLSQQSNSESGLSIPVMLYKLKTNVMYLRLRLVLGLMELFSWMSKVRNFLYFLSGRDPIVGLMERFPWMSKVRNFLYFLFGRAGAFVQ